MKARVKEMEKIMKEGRKKERKSGRKKRRKKGKGRVGKGGRLHLEVKIKKHQKHEDFQTFLVIEL